MSKSKVKTMLIVFFDFRGIVHHEFLPPGQTVTQHVYKEVLERLRKRVLRVRPDLAPDKWVLHHDNAPAHSAISVKQFLAHKTILTLEHAPYSPDLAPCDFFLFPKLKSFLKGTRSDDLEDIKRRTTACLKVVTPEDFQGCFEAWKKRMQKCINSKGEYFEGDRI